MMPEEKWEKYGFPDPTFRTPYLPYVGLCKAINERYHALGTDEDIIEVPDKFSFMEYNYSPNWIQYGIDLAIKEIIFSYINPDKYETLGPNSQYDDMRWSWDDLLLAGADGIEEDVIDTNSHHSLMPNWSAKWAKQRYKMLNLLRYKEVESEYTYLGAESNPKRTKYEAYQDAISRLHTFESDSGPLSIFEGRIAGLEGHLFIVSVEKLIQFRPVIPDVTPPLESWAITDIIAIDEHFDPMGSGLTTGWHKWTAVNGSFIDDPTPPPYVSAWDSFSGDEFYAGWEGGSDFEGYALCYADFNSVFQFKEESQQ